MCSRRSRRVQQGVSGFAVGCDSITTPHHHIYYASAIGAPARRLPGSGVGKHPHDYPQNGRSCHWFVGSSPPSFATRLRHDRRGVCLFYDNIWCKKLPLAEAARLKSVGLHCARCGHRRWLLVGRGEVSATNSSNRCIPHHTYPPASFLLTHECWPFQLFRSRYGTRGGRGSHQGGADPGDRRA